MTTRTITTLALLLALATPLRADEVSDALSAAQAAYAAGDLNTAAAQITTAARAVQALQGGKLAGFLPEAPDGWSREIDASASDGMAMMGMTGTMVQAQYTSAAGESFTLTLTADSPLVAQMAGILGNPQMMALMGKTAKIGGQDMLDQDGALSALVGGRVLVQAQGAPREAMQPVLEKIDFAGLARYDS